jgi:hypothetical protein
MNGMKPTKGKMDMEQSKIIVMAFALLVIVALALYIGVFPHGPLPGVGAPAKGIAVNVPSNYIPFGFPLGIPFDATATAIVNNFTATSTTGQHQATRSFKSTMSVAANYAVYLKFASDPRNGWTIVSQSIASGDPTQATMLLKNSGGYLTVGISTLPPQPGPQTLVELTYITNPPGQ